MKPGNVPGIIHMPNIYKGDKTEKMLAISSPQCMIPNTDGVYVDMPSGKSRSGNIDLETYHYGRHGWNLCL